MRLGNILVGLTLLFASCVSTQPLKAQIGSVKTEEYTAGFEKKKSLDSLPPYTDTIQIPIQILKIGIWIACKNHFSIKILVLEFVIIFGDNCGKNIHLFNQMISCKKHQWLIIRNIFNQGCT